MKLSPLKSSGFLLEALESRIAPASVAPAPLLSEANVVGVTIGTPQLLHAGQMLSTSNSGGSYLLYVQSGSCMVFTTDLNHNGQFDYNEITGIAAGDGLSLISFVEINGDIVTNLLPNGFLTDSDNDASNGRDGLIVLPSHINSITLRSLTTADIGDQNHDGVVDNTDVQARLALSSYSIFGNIYAGGGIGSLTAPGLVIDTTGADLQAGTFTASNGVNIFTNVTPSIGSILTGTATSHQYFGFGVGSGGANIQGQLGVFTPAQGASGGDIIGLQSVNNVAFNLGNLITGDGGYGGRGGNIVNITVAGDTEGGYKITTGNGGDGASGGAGGSIINFADMGSVTSVAYFQTGNGGTGFTGAGGAGGTASFGTMNVAADSYFYFGHGGDGFTNGGTGGGIASQQFTVPTTNLVDPVVIVSTMRDFTPTTGNSTSLNQWTPNQVNPLTGAYIPLPVTSSALSIGNAEVVGGVTGSIEQVDFNGDGYGDAVYSTSNPNGVFVVFGDSSSGTSKFTKVEYLNAPATSAIVIADFNNDGLPDIAVASNDANSFAGITVFINRGNDTSGNHLGFSEGLHTALPDLSSGTNGVYRGAVPVVSISAGDYNGDGIMDLAVHAQYLGPAGGDVLYFMNGVPQKTNSITTDVGTFHPGSGFFSYSQPTVADTPYNYLDHTVIGNFKPLKSTILQSFSTFFSYGENQDVVMTISQDGKGIVTAEEISGFIAGSITSTGQVDTDRSDKVHLQDFVIRDFAIVDSQAAGTADLFLISSSPANFVVMEQGDGFGGFTITTGAGDQAGIQISSDGDHLHAVVATDADGDGHANEVAILDTTVAGPDTEITEYQISTGLTAISGVDVFDFLGDTHTTTFDVYQPNLSATGRVDYVYPIDTSWGDPNGELQIGGDDSFIPQSQDLIHQGFFFHAADGGKGLTGAGGPGGSLGGSLTPTTSGTFGSLSIILPAINSFQAQIEFVAGAGGDGFTQGGAGGSLHGISVTYDTSSGGTLNGQVAFIAGDAGSAVNGIGGAGGSISAIYTFRGDLFYAGNGGSGLTGGAGGSITGNKISGLFDTRMYEVFIKAGDGGFGTNGGGAGGSILSWDSEFPSLVGNEYGFLNYIAGNGGGSISGAGGAGGSILQSGPSTVNNNLANDIYARAGDGGAGRTGGSGGSIVDFINSPSSNVLPDSVTILAGNGGSGTTGNGGNGGSLTNVNITARGTGLSFSVNINDPIDPVFSSSPILESRFLAGNGGDSSGGVGGNGGNLNSVVASSSNSSLIEAAGKGGDGLSKGGLGGSVLSSKGNVGGNTSAKVLIVAGDGGSASAVLSSQVLLERFGVTTTTASALQKSESAMLALGAANGIGGNGGSINGFVQPTSPNIHTDLIAGNGGDTINYGTPTDSKYGVGVGGSVSNTTLYGFAGNVDQTTVIRAYNDIIKVGGASGSDRILDETMADFITQTVLNHPQFAIDDSTGNVGVIVGGAGRVRNDLPASLGVAGSVTNFSAQGIMSMVANSVDDVVAIQAISGVSLPISAIVGADKNTIGTSEYYDVDKLSVVSTINLDGALLDGAIVAKSITGLSGSRVFIRQ